MCGAGSCLGIEAPCPTRKDDLWLVCPGLLSRSPQHVTELQHSGTQNCGFPLSHISRCRESSSLSAEQLSKIVDILHFFGCLLVRSQRVCLRPYLSTGEKKGLCYSFTHSNVIFKIIAHLVDV